MLNKKEALKIARKHAIKKIGKINENLTYDQIQNNEYSFTFFSVDDVDTEITVWVNGVNGSIIRDDNFINI